MRTVAADPFAGEIPMTLIFAIAVVLIILILVVVASPMVSCSFAGLILGAVLGTGKIRARGKR